MTRDVTSDAPDAGGRHRSPDRTIEDVRLPPRIRWPLLTALVLIFLFAGEPQVWENPFDIDRAIWLSYAPIPVLVGLGLWWSKRLSAATLFLNTVEIVLAKFALTYTIAMVAWAVFVKAPTPPEAAQPTAPPVVNEVEEEAPDPTPWPDDQRGRIAGEVRLDDGKPAANAFVYVSSGLDDIVFERPREERMLTLDGEGFGTELIVARRWQPLSAHSSDGRLHTVFIEGEQRSFRAVPLLPSGAPSRLPLRGVRGVVPIGCSAHKKRAHIAVLHHPHATRADAEGRFVLEGVPALEVSVSAWLPKHKGSISGTASGHVEPSGELTLDVTMPR